MENGVELSELYSSASSDSVNSVVLAVRPDSISTAAPGQAGRSGGGTQRRRLQNGDVCSQLPRHAVVDDDGSSSDDDDDILRADDDVEMRRQCELLNTTSSSSSEENIIA